VGDNGKRPVNGWLEDASTMVRRLRDLDTTQKDMKESHPVETAEFAKARGIDDEVTFA
jgi:hypothetical protein